MTTILTTFQIRRDTAANWTSVNPVLAEGEPGLETDTRKVKWGDGATAWASLAYEYDATGGGGGGGGYTLTSTAVGYTETATSGEVVVRVTASGQTIVLPTAISNTAKFTFKLMVTGTLTIDGNGAQTIDGGATAVLTVQYEAITLVSDNANWIVI